MRGKRGGEEESVGEVFPGSFSIFNEGKGRGKREEKEEERSENENLPTAKMVFAVTGHLDWKA